ncbi:hypothetical protein [Bacillus sp. 165]|uniref:hypothetical protein n=1 Tax=Bacillus sp. 165 TaxID=1529117 RepID=UPI001ADC8E21|nr:hypothetical protein [Bacillus sp. 165]MBO9129525.1 hypothetical protein [Bacillus sp. 165]
MKVKFILLGVLAIGVIVGMLSQVILLFQASDNAPASFLIIGIVSFAGLLFMLIRNILPELRLGLPLEDERSKKVKIYSAGRAYFYSLYIWIILFALQKYLDKDDVLILGLFGMGISLYVSWFFTRNKKGLE